MESCSRDKAIIIPVEAAAASEEEGSVSVSVSVSVSISLAGPVANNDTFGSMNMDDFLTNIWTTEEANQNLLPSTGVRTSPEAAWSEMHTEQQQQQQQQACQFTPGSAAPPQLNFGEMTLEDFLVKAGVLRDNPQCIPPPLPPPPDKPAGIGGTVRKKRTVDGPVAERREKRMIKNRESAARSRSRKQAYTAELVSEVDNLNQENSRLVEEHVRTLLT